MKRGAGEMAQGLWAFPLTEDQLLARMSNRSQLRIIPVPKDLMPSSGLQQHPHLFGEHKLMQVYIHIHK